jgi:RecB family exonuclease
VIDSPAAPYDSRANNVHALARLALAGVAGADPSQWLGILEPSTSEPLFHTEGELDSVIPISPSQLERFVECPLHWFISYHGGDDAGFEASLGTILHAALEKSNTGTVAELESLVDEQWPSLRFEADWLSRTAKRKALNAIHNIAAYLSAFNASGAQLVGAETKFEFELGEAKVAGTIDRIERTADGELSVVDLKTGKSTNFTVPNTAVNPQLLTYQLGIELDQKLAGELREQLSAEPQLEGAKLVIVGDDKTTIRNQASIQGDNQLRETIKEIIKTATTEMSQPIFVAKVGKHCDASRFGEPCKLHIIEAVSYVG